MHAWDIVGYAFDGALYCPRHVPRAARETKCECPVFACDAAPGDACDVYGCGYLDGCEPEEEEATDDE
jgi:hypothetical protein